MWKIFVLIPFLLIAFFSLRQTTVSADVNYMPVYRFWSDLYQKHFFTIDGSEKVSVENNYDDHIWRYEGIAFDAVAYGAACPDNLYPVYRFWNIKRGGHFYTVDLSEKLNIEQNLQNDWRYEMIAFCAAKIGGDQLNPVYRFWSERKGGHFFTISAAEKVYVTANYQSEVWRYEMVAFYAKGDAGISVPEPVGYQCPSYTQSCVPCTPGEQYCRVESGKSIGFKGWSCQNNNPGNIRYSDYRNGLIVAGGGVASCGERGSFMVFKDYATGRLGLSSYISSISLGRHSAYPECGNCNLKYFFARYAPSSDGNNPDAYALDVATRIGVNADTTTLSWIVENKLTELVDAIQIHEGWFSYQ